MKTNIINYSFNKTTKQITFKDFTLINLEGIYPIVNTTVGQVIYNPTKGVFGGTTADNILTLNYDTSLMLNTDKLMIFYEDGRIVPTADENALANENQTNWLLRRMVKMMESNTVVDSNSRQKVVVEALVGSSLGLPIYGPASGQQYPSTNVPTANAPAQSPSLVYWQPVWVGPVDQRWEITDRARTAYNLGIRNNLIFS